MSIYTVAPITVASGCFSVEGVEKIDVNSPCFIREFNPNVENIANGYILALVLLLTIYPFETTSLPKQETTLS